MAELKDYSIIYFGNDWRTENRTSSHHIAARLAERAPVLYVECPGLRAPAVTSRDGRRMLRKLADMLRPPVRIGPQMWRMTMPQIPFRRIAAVRRLNVLLGILMIRRAMRRLHIGPRILWFLVPHATVVQGHLGESFTVYYCTDEYAAFPNVDRAAVERMDLEITRKADQVFVVSPQLLEPKRTINPSTTHSPHGVDAKLFAMASDPSTPVPPAASRLQAPVIGFYGLIEAWIDLDLVAFLAKSRPKWTFLMIGRLAVDAGDLKSAPNVIFTGPQPYEDLPKWVKAFDVAIIPYVLNKQVMQANPLKLREYLATGKPIVAVSTPEIDRFASTVRIASDRHDFLRGIEECLTGDSDEKRRQRIAAVADSSWERRVEEIIKTVESGLTKTVITRH